VQNVVMEQNGVLPFFSEECGDKARKVIKQVYIQQCIVGISGSSVTARYRCHELAVFLQLRSHKQSKIR